MIQILGYIVSAAIFLVGKIGSCEAKRNWESKLLNACIRLDSVREGFENQVL